MTLFLGVCGCAALFVLFGVIGGRHEQHEKTHGCDTCSTEDNNAQCGVCDKAREISEHSHA
jgi:hypothetical protein